MKTTLLERRRSQGHVISAAAESLPKQQQQLKTPLLESKIIGKI